MKMKKFINNPENLVGELLEGYALAYPKKVKLAGKNIVVRAVPKATGKVGVVTLGGSGHEPGLSGFVGMGLLDASVPGEIFAARVRRVVWKRSGLPTAARECCWWFSITKATS